MRKPKQVRLFEEPKPGEPLRDIDIARLAVGEERLNPQWQHLLVWAELVIRRFGDADRPR